MSNWESIGQGAFSNCSKLENVYFDDGFNLNISSQMFWQCTSLKKVSIPSGVKSVETNAFSWCTNLTTITFEGATTYFSSLAYGSCPNFRTIRGYDCSRVKMYYDSLTKEQKGKLTFESLGEGKHQFTAEKVQIKEPTCTEKGSKAYRCEICGEIQNEEEIPAYGHKWNNGVITKQATETEEGEIKYTCWRCNETKTESIPKLSAINLQIDENEQYWNGHYQYRFWCTSNKDVTYYAECVGKDSEQPVYDSERQDGEIDVDSGKWITVDIPDEDAVDIYVFATNVNGDHVSVKVTPNYDNRPEKPAIKVGDNATAIIDGDTITITGTGETYDAAIDWSSIDKSKIKKIIFNGNITYLGDGSFSGFTNVESIILPDTLEVIGWNALSKCSALKELKIPNSVKRIEDYAFENCTALTNIAFSDSITTIGSSAFSNCTSLDKITLPSELTSLGNGVFENCNAEIIFPASLKCIPELGNNAVKKVKIPEGVEIIGEDAFWGCSNLFEITLPSTITSIESGAFSGTGITAFNYPQDITSIPANIFINTNLKEFSVPEKVTEIGDSAFYDCADLEKITIPKSVTYIGTGTFAKCRNLTIYGFKDSAAESYAKANNIKFVSADYKVIFKDNGRTKKTEYVTKGQNATPPTLEDKVGYTLSWDADYTNIQEDMVINAVWTKKDNGGGNTTIIVSPSETNKYTVTFKDRGKIVKTEKVKSGDAAEYPFINRSGYELSWDKDFSKVTANITVNAVWTVIKPNKVTSLTAEVQKTSIDLSWDRAENTDYYLVYRKATSDTEYKQIKKTTKILWTDEDVEPGTEYSYKVVGICSVDAKKYQGADSDIVTAKIGTPQIGDVYSVGNLKYKVTDTKEVSVMGLAKATDTLIIPSSVTISGKVYKVTSIQEKTFYRNEDIVNVAIGNNVTYVGKYTFYQCPSLETVKFGKRVSTISTCAFTQCPNLDDVILPSSIRRIGAKAFYQCTSIETLKINGSVLEYVGKKGLAVNKTVTLRLPKNVYTKYKELIKASGVYSKTKYTKF